MIKNDKVRWETPTWSRDKYDKNEEGAPVLASRKDIRKELDVEGNISVAEFKMASKTRNDYVQAAISKLSPERRDQLEESLAIQNLGSDGRGSVVKGSHRPEIYKAAQAGSDSVIPFSGRGDTTHLLPSLYSPLWLTANLQLPRDRPTANAWNRAYYDTNPMVRNAINLHATYPIAKMTIKCRDKAKERFYLDMAESVNLFQVVRHVALEWWKMGEAYPYANLNEKTGMWDSIYCHNPDFIVVQETAIPNKNIVALRPHPKLRKIVESNDPAMAAVREQLDPRLLDAISRNEYMPLDDYNISHLKNDSGGYDLHGQSVIQAVWKDLVLWDMLRENKFIQADAMVNPMTQVKVGASNPDGHYPTKDYMNSVRDIFEEAQFNKDFKLFTPDNISVERIGYSSGVLDISADLTMIQDNILIGLMVPKSLLTQEGATYASASVSLEIIRTRYEDFRAKISNWLITKIFAPIAEINEFYEYEGGIKRLILPEIEWNKMTLHDNDQYIGHLMSLRDKPITDQPSSCSDTTIYRSLGLNLEDELANQKKEFIQKTILAKEMEQIKKMSLTELRSLGPEDSILEKDEPDDDLLPGVPGDMGGAMPDLEMGGGPLPGGSEPPMPDMGSPPEGA